MYCVSCAIKFEMIQYNDAYCNKVIQNIENNNFIYPQVASNQGMVVTHHNLPMLQKYELKKSRI